MKQVILIVFLAIVNANSFAQQMGSFRDARDGQMYRTVKIGNQIWMAENLNYDAKFGCFTHEYIDVYDRILINKDKRILISQINESKYYGYKVRCYTYETAQNVCPNGWHLPSQKEWDKLINTFGGLAYAGNNILYGGRSNFNILLIGSRNSNGKAFNLWGYTGFWSSSDFNKKSAWAYLFNLSNKIFIEKEDKEAAYPIRCIKN